MIQHRCHTAGIMVRVGNVSGCSTLDHLKLQYVLLGERHQIVEQYSSTGRTIVIYTAVFVSSLLIFKFLLKNPNVLLLLKIVLLLVKAVILNGWYEYYFCCCCKIESICYYDAPYKIWVTSLAVLQKKLLKNIFLLTVAILIISAN